MDIYQKAFMGTESRKVDSKGRVVISKIFNLQPYQKVAFLHGVNGRDCFRITCYEYLKEKLDEMNKMRIEASNKCDSAFYGRIIEEFERRIEEAYALTVDVSQQIDPQNRVLIPSVIRKAYDIKFNSEIIFQGLGAYINCYPNDETYNHYIDEIQKQKRTR